MIKKDLYKALKTLKGIYTEIDIQSRINHPNIIRLLYVKERSESFDLVMEFAKYGNLYHYIKKHSYLSEDKSFKFFIQVVNAIYFLHKNDLIHRDIKPENILLFDDCVKLCDFGWCTRLDGGNRGTFCGTAEYMSPEMVNKEEYSKDIDIWSLGILLYEMIHGHSPFKPNKANFNINDIMDNIKIQNLKLLSSDK
jgi:serine/threonine protein kinase